MKALRVFTVVSALALGAPAQAAASAVTFGPNDVRSAFHVAKSENQNQVHYGVRLDAACRPVGARPVFAYWRRLKQGVRVDEPLEGAGVRLYGASEEQQVKSLAAGGGQVQMYVRALERVRIDIQVTKTSSGCKATATTTLKGARARLSHAYLQLGAFALRVKYVDVIGYRASDGQRVTERFD